ncbi:MAG: multiheme c-type cytochrome, partial [Myxococcota bacterium]
MRAVPRHRFVGTLLLLLTLGVGCEAPVEPGPVDELFVSGAVCAGCHPAESDRWAGSHHDLAMQEASRETVLGDFSGTVFTHLGVSSRFFERNGAFFVETEGPFGEMGEFEIAYTFGVEPLQQYLVEFPGGRLQSLTIAWDTERRRWFSLYPDERITPDDPLHWTGRYQNWNAFCAECHSTHLRKGYDATADRYQTTWVDIDVSCEACHGPGRDHVRWARDPGDPDYEGPGLSVRFSASDPTREVESCAPCHSRRHRVSGEDEHGRPYLDDFMPELLSTDLYHVDGQILEEVYVYGSFLQSRMHQQGVRCSDCHDPHSLEIRAEGNALCVQCHTEQPPARFPTLARRRYDDPAHHFH